MTIAALGRPTSRDRRWLRYQRLKVGKTVIDGIAIASPEAGPKAIEAALRRLRNRSSSALKKAFPAGWAGQFRQIRGVFHSGQYDYVIVVLTVLRIK